MKKIIIIIILIGINVSIGISQRRYRTKCIMNFLYYDWDGRRFGQLIPVLDKSNNMIFCKGEK